MTRGPFTAKGRTVLSWQRHRVTLRASEDVLKDINKLWRERTGGQECIPANGAPCRAAPSNVHKRQTVKATTRDRDPARDQSGEARDGTAPSRKEGGRGRPRQQAPRTTSTAAAAAIRPPAVVSKGSSPNQRQGRNDAHVSLVQVPSEERPATAGRILARVLSPQDAMPHSHQRQQRVRFPGLDEPRWVGGDSDGLSLCCSSPLACPWIITDVEL